MGGAQTLQVRNIGLQPGLQHQPFIAGRNGLGHGVPVRLTFVQISQPADRGIAGKSRGDEPGVRSLFCYIVASSEPCVLAATHH